MTTKEFSIEFDILYNNLASNAAPPLNEYEKSVFLTKAQSEIVLELYSGRNQLGLSFESTEEVRRYLRNLLIEEELEADTSSSSEEYKDYYHSNDILFRTKIEAKTDKKIIPVVLVGHDEVFRLLNNPFKNGNSKRRIIGVEYYDHIRLYVDADDYTITAYGIKTPDPIILDGILDPSITIEGRHVAVEDSKGDIKATPMESELPEVLHPAILDRAVLLAKQAYIGGQAQS